MDRPIGMFDSGFGGLTVARALIDLLPNEDIVYIGDTARYPYGSKPQSEVRDFARQLAWSLVKDFDAKGVQTLDAAVYVPPTCVGASDHKSIEPGSPVSRMKSSDRQSIQLNLGESTG